MSEEELLTDESDDEAFKKYRLERISKMQSKSAPVENVCQFGKLDEVTVENYLEEVEECEGLHWVVVHLYEPYVEISVRLNFALMNLAEQFPYVHFVRGRASDLLPDFDEIGLATLILYQQRQQKFLIIRIQDQIGSNFSDKDVVGLLNKHGVFSNVQENEEAKPKAKFNRVTKRVNDD